MYEEVVEEGRDPRVPRSQCPKVQGSHGPSYLKVTFKYELDSKEGLSCFGSLLQEYLNIFFTIFDLCKSVPFLNEGKCIII